MAVQLESERRTTEPAARSSQVEVDELGPTSRAYLAEFQAVLTELSKDNGRLEVETAVAALEERLTELGKQGGVGPKPTWMTGVLPGVVNT